MKKWYVHDEADCFFDYPHDQSGDAMRAADDLTQQGFEGVHVVCMTEAQHTVYCETGDLRKAQQAK